MKRLKGREQAQWMGVKSGCLVLSRGKRKGLNLVLVEEGVGSQLESKGEVGFLVSGKVVVGTGKGRVVVVMGRSEMWKKTKNNFPWIAISSSHNYSLTVTCPGKTV